MSEEYNHYWNQEHPLRPYTMTQPANPGSFPPSNASRTAPGEPTPPGKWPAWDGEGWIFVDDHRGESGWVDGVRTEIKDLGPLPEGWSDTAPEPTPAEVKAAKEAAILAALDELDRKSMRSVRAVEVLRRKLEAGPDAALEGKLASEETYLAGLEDKAEAKRAELATLGETIQ
jgi:hypothetical protein